MLLDGIFSRMVRRESRVRERASNSRVQGEQRRREESFQLWWSVLIDGFQYAHWGFFQSDCSCGAEPRPARLPFAAPTLSDIT